MADVSVKEDLWEATLIATAILSIAAARTASAPAVERTVSVLPLKTRLVDIICPLLNFDLASRNPKLAEESNL